MSDGAHEHGRGPHGTAPLFAILTLFPEALQPYLEAGIVGIAQRRGLVRLRLVDFRDFARDRHRTVDDRPFGGGPGMVLRPEPIVECVEWLEQREGPFRKLLLCPGGRRFDQGCAAELASEPRVLLLCGRYEGFDERISELCAFEPLSIGDYVLAGGEIPALAVTEACVRLLPGALGDERSAAQDSFSGEALDHPHYTRPREYRGLTVPEVLLEGDHARIARWRERMAHERTRKWRPDLLRNPTADVDERRFTTDERAERGSASEIERAEPSSASVNERAEPSSAQRTPAVEHEAQPPPTSPGAAVGSDSERTRPLPQKGRSKERGCER